MGIRSGFFNSRNGDRRYDAQVFTDLFAKLMTNGIYATPATNFQIQATSPASMTIVAAEGFGMINGYYALNDGDYALTVDTADGTYARKDRIVLRLNITNREIQLILLKGTAAANPAAPLLVRDGTYYDLGLAIIYVAANATSITQDNITDTRQNSTVCGIITGAVSSIDTTNLFAQYDAQWQLLKALCEQDQAGILAQFANIVTVQKVNNVIPDSDKNVTISLSNIADDDFSKIAGVKNLLIQSGVATISSSGGININFEKAYDEIPNVTATLMFKLNNFTGNVWLNNITKNGFHAGIKIQTYDEPGIFSWIAIGEYPGVMHMEEQSQG